MRPLFLAAVATLTVTALTILALRAGTATAQDPTRILYVSGLEIDGSRPTAIVRLTNGSDHASDTMSVHYTIRGPAAGAPMSLPGAGPIGASLRPGRTLELDLGAIVTAYRKSLGLGPYTGPVQFVASAEGGIFRKFGPDVVAVDATQISGRARYQALVEWR